MRKWLAGAVCAATVLVVGVPTQAQAQGGWLKKIDDARRKIDQARATKDSAAATLRGVRGGAAEDSGAVMPAGGGGSEAGGAVVRTSSTGGRRRPGCMAYNTFQCAAPGALGDRLDGAIGGNGPKVFARYTVDQPGVYRLTLDPMPNRDGVTVYVTDGQYQELGRFRWGAGQPGTQLLQVASPGTYYAVLESYPHPAEAFSFAIALNTRSRPAPPPTPVADEPGGAACSLNNTFQCADDAEVGKRVTGAIGGNARRLYYRVEVSQPGTMEFVLNPMPNRAAVHLTVSDAEYQRLGRLTYPAGQPKAQLFRVAAAGTYFVHLDGGGQSAERFALTVRQQP